ncbi:CIA30 family protein [Mycobacterium sp. SA01]|uniref:CIA30 family protein n=1 Tax=Mycobacterium sp. SA01 TaxID=3238820 RepID=UPI00351ACA97
MAALSTLLLVSCGSGERPAGADATTTASAPGRSSAPAAENPGSEVPLVSLNAADVARWTAVNDPVMGGRSTSNVAYGDGGLVFSGTISLANNGGFASARSPEDPDIGRRAAGATSIRVRAVGDGKTYVLRVGAEGQPWSYIQRFRTEAGVQRTYELAVGAFQPVGMRMDPAPQAPATLDPSSISGVSVYILDKQQGPFAITITGIDAAH